MTNVFQLAQIPDDLAAEAAMVPGLHLRVASFISGEVAQYRKKKARKLVEEVRAEVDKEAERLQNAGMTSDQARKEFVEEYLKIMDQIEQRQKA